MLQIAAQTISFSVSRLEDLFRPVLHKERVDENWSAERKISAFFDSDSAYVAVTQNGKYEALISRLTGLNLIMKSLAERKNKI